ncbi:MAG: FeoC-like transcriptional regulator [Candidatus Helarchaeota archaeon]
MFKNILKYIKEKKVVNIQEIAKNLKIDTSIISDSIKLLATKGYLKNLDCCIIDPNLKFKCIGCSQRFQCHLNPANMYELTSKGIEYLKKKEVGDCQL